MYGCGIKKKKNIGKVGGREGDTEEKGINNLFPTQTSEREDRMKIPVNFCIRKLDG